MDAVGYEFPGNPLVIYTLNPFNGKVREHVAATVARTIADYLRDVFIMYSNLTGRDIFNAIPSVKFVVDDPDYMIYRTPMESR
jgi:hypothetical protein